MFNDATHHRNSAQSDVFSSLDDAFSSEKETV
jgi:hypothetical protein